MPLLIWMVCLSSCLDRDFEDTVSCPPFCCCVGEGFIDDVVVVVAAVNAGSFVVILAISSASIVVVVGAPAAGMNSDSCSCFSASFWIRSFTYSAGKLHFQICCEGQTKHKILSILLSLLFSSTC